MSAKKHSPQPKRSEALSGRLSKSASELSCAPVNASPPRARSAHHHTPLSVVHRTQHFFTNLKSRWTRSRSRERCPAGTIFTLAPADSSGTEYADQSSEHSTPAHSPRHRGKRNSMTRQVSTDPAPSTSGTPAHHPRPPPAELMQLEPDESQRSRQQILRQYSFFQLRVHLKRGQNLVAMDKNGLLSGTSDPYVKFKAGGRLLHKSRIVYRDLNPVWDECFTVPVEDPFLPVQIKVFDYDWGLQDDFMGSCQLDLTALELGRTQDLVLCLHDPAKPGQDMGEIVLNVTLWPKSQEDKDQVLQPSEPLAYMQSCYEGGGNSSAISTAPLLNTMFGYVIAGNIHASHVQPVVTLFCNTCDSDLNQTLIQFWKSESIPETFTEAHSEHDLCEQVFSENVQFDTQKNQIQVVLPLKLPLHSINQNLGDSLHLALKRLYNLEARFSKDPNLYKLYKDFIHDYLQQGHGTIIEISQYNLTNDPVYFLPHHPVLRLDKKTTKCRVVFDGSMKTSTKTSLNNLLLNGPVVQKELVDVLLLFRVHKYFFITDIKNMFRNILLHPEYRSLQNILWRDTPNESVKCIQLNTVSYGLKSSSYLATRCLKLLADLYINEFPIAAFIINNSTYVDDILYSDLSSINLVEARRQLCSLLSLGSFQLHKWVSNSTELLQLVPHSQRHFDEVDLEKNNFTLKTLGMNYNTESDSFVVSSPKAMDSMPQSKREILSFISKFYDPLGLAGPIVVGAKVIMQRLWLAKLEWDSLPDRELLQLWHEFYNSLLAMKPIPIQRYIGLQNICLAQLIGFADASSTTAYGCNIYLRVVDSLGNIKITLLCSKSRINPIAQSLSVPRLELNAALLLAKLSSRVYDTLSVKMHIHDVILYSDSQIVLAWLKTNINILKAYVANRVQVITQLTQSHTWSYVGSTDNPVDCLSRGVKPEDLADHQLWWTGPPFLHTSKYRPESKFTLPQNLPEVKDSSACLNAMLCTSAEIQTLNLDFLDKFSDINKMQRVLAYILRFCQNAKNKVNRNKLNYITSQELELSMSLIIKHEQQKHLFNEIHVLKCGKTISKGNLKPLSPFIDNDGLVRVGGRLQNACISYSQKHPIILPRDSRVTDLIIVSEHLKAFHAGPKLVLANIRQRYWIVHALRQVKKVLHKCIVCFRLKAEASKQLMGSLPHDRVNACRPFQKAGLDYAGPIPLKLARIRKPIITKGYICIFVCFVTKAIHVELASDLKTETFIACLNRFISRRGAPTDIYSDNASTFKCARTQLGEMYQLHNSADHQKQVCQFASHKRINFHFLPCYSPVFAGLAEAGVKSVKYHLKRVLLKSILNYEELYTVLCQIEAILNSRPLMPLSNDITDYSCITPGHFLIGTALNSYPDCNVNAITRSQFWRICNDMRTSFWKVWSKHYLNLLQSRPKWQDPQPNVKVGSLVILRDDNLSPLNWPLARITNIFPGKDNKVRVVEVKTSNGHTHRRAVMKVCVLPQEGNND